MNKLLPPIPSFLLKLDMFGASLPSFNLGRQKTTKTSIGAVISMVVMFMTFGFALLKLQRLLLRKRPDLVKYIDKEAFENTEKFSIRDNDFMVAASLESWVTGSVSDPRHI